MEGSYMTDMIVTHDKDINDRVNVVDQLLGNYGDKKDIKDKFLQMILIEKDASAYGQTHVVERRANKRLSKTGYGHRMSTSSIGDNTMSEDATQFGGLSSIS